MPLISAIFMSQKVDLIHPDTEDLDIYLLCFASSYFNPSHAV